MVTPNRLLLLPQIPVIIVTTRLLRSFQSPTVRDYLKHVAELDRMYGADTPSNVISVPVTKEKTVADVLARSVFPPPTTATTTTDADTPRAAPKPAEPPKFVSGGSRKRRNDTAIDKAFNARGA